MRTAFVTKATEQEKADYAKTGPVYRLYGWCIVDGKRCAVEDLSSWPKGDPQYEVIAPERQHFNDGDQLHTLLCFDMKDLKNRCGSASIEPCTEECDA